MSSSFRLNLNDPNITLTEILSRFPPAFKGQFALGIRQIAKLTDKQISHLLEVVKDSIAATTPVDDKDVASRFGMEPEDATAMLLAANILVVTLVPGKTSPEQMLLQLRNASVIEEKESSSPIRFLNSVERIRGSVTEALQLSSLVAEGLPILTEFETTVDIRPAFDKENNTITMAVPVLIMHLDTDKYGAEIWLQINKRQLEKIIDDLKTALHQMNKAEQWSNQILNSN
jgi:hypothetical protein